MWQHLIAIGVGIGVGLYLLLANRQYEEQYHDTNSRSERAYQRRYYSNESNDEEDTASQCSICLAEIEKKRRGYINCGHEFHYDCISKWKLLSPNSFCPNCRMPFQTILKS